MQLQVAVSAETLYTPDGEARVPALRLICDPADEEHARRVLESLGAIELACLDDCELAGDAEYVVAVDEDPHAACAFTAYALPQLRARGWRVDIDPGQQHQR